MQKTYVTFGLGHTHSVNGKTLDKDTIAVLQAEDAEKGRERAFELFGALFCMEYPEANFDHDKMMPYFPKGLVVIDG